MGVNKLLEIRRSSRASLVAPLSVCMLILLFCNPSSAQSSAQYSGPGSSVSATTTTQPKSGASPAPAPNAPDPGKPQHLAAPTGPPPDIANRQALEQHAGKNSCKLLLRSIPSLAQVFVDGAFVGDSPVLLIIAPGKYQIEMRGHRQESAQRLVDLLPRETREVALSLTERYPTRVTAH